MKKRVSVRELMDYYARNKPKEISFATENQPWYKVSDPCKVRCTFPVMMICENPNLVCLKSGRNTICFDRVELAEVDTDATVLGTVVKLFCGSQSESNDAEASYILVVA